MGRKRQTSKIVIEEVIDNTLSDKILEQNYASIKELIAQKFDLNVRNSERQTPLEVALLNADFKAAEILIEGGANIKAVTKLGLTFVHIIIRKTEEYSALGRSHDEIIAMLKKLIDKGADLRIQERRGNTAINILAQLAKANKPAAEIYTKLAKLLLTLDTYISQTIQIKNNMGKSPMDYLARNGNVLLREAMYEKLPYVQNKISEELKQKNRAIEKLIALDKELVR